MKGPQPPVKRGDYGDNGDQHCTCACLKLYRLKKHALDVAKFVDISWLNKT